MADLSRTDVSESALRLDTIQRRIEEIDPLTVIFDFYDTLVFRRCATPESLFLEVFRSLPDSLRTRFATSKSFRNLRIDAEHSVRISAPNREVTLMDIWMYLTGNSENLSAIGAMSEQSTERRLTSVDPFVAALLRNLYEQNRRVLIASDTYLGTDFIRSLLSEDLLDCVPTDHIFASCDIGVGKVSGLFQRIVQNFGLDPSKTLVIGDNYHADIKSAVDLGFKAIHLPNGTSQFWTRFSEEGSLNSIDRVEYELDDGLTSSRTRAARCLVLKNEGQEQDLANETRAEIAVEIMGPILSGYGSWVNRESDRLSLSALVALKREGGLLASAVRRYRPDRNINDFSVSRRALLLPSIFVADQEELSGLLQNYYPQLSSVSELASALEVEVSTILNFDEMTRDDFLAHVETCQTTRLELLKLAETSRSQLLSELSDALDLQEDSELPIRVGLLDVGWNGTIQALLARIFEKCGVKVSLVGLYLGTSMLATHRHSRNSIFLGYLFDGDPDLGGMRGSLGIIEQLLTDGTSPRISYLRSTATRESSSPMGYQRMRTSQIQDLALEYIDFVSRLGLRESIHWTSDDVRHVLRNLLRRLVMKPMPREILAFSGWTHDDSSRMDETNVMVPTKIMNFGRFMNLETIRSELKRDYSWVGAAAAYSHYSASDIYSHTSDTGPAVVSTLYQLDENGAQMATRQISTTLNRAGLVYVDFGDTKKVASAIRLDPIDRAGMLQQLKFFLAGGSACPISHHEITEYIWRGMSKTSEEYWFCTDDPRVFIAIPSTSCDCSSLIMTFGMSRCDSPYLSGPESKGKATVRNLLSLMHLLFRSRMIK